MGYSKIVNAFFASKGPAHGERKMRGIMLTSLDSWGDGAGRDNKFSFPFPPPPLPAHGNYNYFHDDRHGLTYRKGLKNVTRFRRGLP